MTCEEFERVLPEFEDAHSDEQQFHLHSCSACSELVEDLIAITREARFLQNTALDEPNARVWNSIEIALRQEGLIRDSAYAGRSVPYLIPARPRPRRLPWLIPAGAILLLVFGLVQYEHSRNETAPQSASTSSNSQRVAGTNPPAASALNRENPEDRQLLEAVSTRTPSMRASYAASLQDVNSYIRDAEASVKTDPNDEQAQRYLISAYEEKSMLYQMALDKPFQEQ
jgi:hypothetical protein